MLSLESDRKFRSSFNGMIDCLNIHQQDYNILKAKSLSSNFGVAFITSRLLMG